MQGQFGHELAVQGVVAVSLAYAIGRAEPVAVDEGPNTQMTQTCGRCHSYARVALQRRTPEDWAHLVNFHLGQFPTLEYQALARDRDWWSIAQAEVIPFLAKTYPLGEAPAAFAGDASGDYVLAGRVDMTSHADPSMARVAMGNADAARWLIARQDIDYLVQMMFRLEPFHVLTAPVHLGTSSIVLATEIVDPDDGIVHAKARTVLVCADEAGHKRPLPDAARAALEKLLTTQ